jgi:hypothetical protein
MGMSTAAMFPEVSSEYTDPKTGLQYSVPCYIPGAEAETEKNVCPDPFLVPNDENHPRTCILPCPVPAYTDDQYNIMWEASCTAAVIGLILNTFMVATWCIGGRKTFDNTKTQLVRSWLAFFYFTRCVYQTNQTPRFNPI